jgi:Trypsin
MKLAAIFLTIIGTFAGTCLAVSKIINGELATEGQFPHQVQLSIKNKDSTRYCGGSLLNSQWVLTVSADFQGQLNLVNLMENFPLPRQLTASRRWCQREHILAQFLCER